MWLNYHHLLYFYVVAREGGITAASRQLRLAPATISAQVKQLERRLGEKLFERVGRTLSLTKSGKIAFSYAESIFSLGTELQSALGSESPDRLRKLVVGITDVVPKLVAFRLLQPALELAEGVQLICKEGKAEELLVQLSTHELDVLITDAPADPALRIRAYNHRLGECGVTFFAVSSLATQHRAGFPQSLNGAPVLLPTGNTTVRRSLDQWIANLELEPKIVGEFEDSALMKVFGQSGVGIFPGPRIIEDDIVEQYGVEVVGRTNAVSEKFFAISLNRRLRNPAVVHISESARGQLFDESSEQAHR